MLPEDSRQRGGPRDSHGTALGQSQRWLSPGSRWAPTRLRTWFVTEMAFWQPGILWLIGWALACRNFNPLKESASRNNTRQCRHADLRPKSLGQLETTAATAMSVVPSKQSRYNCKIAICSGIVCRLLVESVLKLQQIREYLLAIFTFPTVWPQNTARHVFATSFLIISQTVKYAWIVKKTTEYLYIYIYVSIYQYIYTSLSMYIYISIYTYIYKNIYIYLYTSISDISKQTSIYLMVSPKGNRVIA